MSSSSLQGNALLLRAATFAATKHRKQTRKGCSAPPYINHCLEVARLLADVGGLSDDVPLLCAALLHDTVEDTKTTLEEIQALFGAEIAQLVCEVTDDKSLHWKERKRLQIETAASKSLRVKCLKLADKICNVRDIAHDPPRGWGVRRRRDYLDWSARVVEGLRGSNTALEQLFDELLNDAYRQLA